MTLRATIVAALLAVVAAHSMPAQGKPAPAGRTVEVAFEIVMSGNMSINDAREQATKFTYAEALRTVVGTRIEALQQRFQRDGTELSDRFLSVVQASTAGRVVNHRFVIAEIVQRVAMGGVAVPFYKGTMSVTVAEETGKSDPAFALTMLVGTPRDSSAPVFTARQGEDDGDEIVTRIRCTKDGYVTLFNVTDDTVQVLLPSSGLRDNQIRAGELFEFPSAASRRARQLTIRAYLPPVGPSKASEMMIAVLTKQPVPFDGDVARRSADLRTVPTVQGTLDKLSQWLVGIPQGERAIAFAAYEIHRAAK